MSENIEYHKFPRGEHCDEEGCRSKQYYIDSGRQFCKRGHIQAQFTQTQQDEDDWNTQGKKTRKRREQKEKVKTLYSGQEARQLFLQCYQLLLWKQVHWLVTVQKFPKELETLVRDLWSCRIKKLLPDDDSGDETASTRGAFSSTGEDTGAETDATFATSTSAGKENSLGGLKLIDTLGLCYLGMVLLRLPVSVGQLHRWAEREEIIYIRAIRFVPPEMIAKLPPSYHRSLDTQNELRAGQLQKSISMLARIYISDFEIEFPALNTPIIIFRYIKELGLPLEVFLAVQRLAKLLSIDFTLSRSQMIRAAAHPEAKIVALLIIATKLSHPLDDISRVPKSLEDPSSLVMDWNIWKDAMVEQQSDRLKKGKEVQVTDQEVLSMSGEKLDDYLDWYQQMWIDGTEPKLPQQIVDLFPLAEPTGRNRDEEIPVDITERTKYIQSSLLVTKPISDEDAQQIESVNRPGSLYAHYRTVEEMPDNAKAFYEKTAELAAMQVDTVVRAVFQLETKLQDWVTEDRRRQIAERIA